MDKRVVIFILALLILPSVLAVEISMNDNYQQGETIIAKVSGNFLTSVTKDNVLFYRGHVRIPMEHDVTKIGNDYYIYATLSDKEEGDYSLSMENIKYMKGAETSEENAVKNFSITNATADFSIKPGFVVTSENFFLEIQDLQDAQINVDVKTESNISGGRDIFISDNGQFKQKSFSLISGETKKINFELGTGEQTFQNIELKTNNTSYRIPVYVTTSLEGEKQKILEFKPDESILSLRPNSTEKKTIYLYNKGDKKLENISLSLSGSLKTFVTLSKDKIDSLDINSSAPIELSFSSPTENEAEGTLKAKTVNETTSFFISLNFIENYTPPIESSSPKTCAELNGTVFNTETEKCDGESVYARDNNCCLGNVQKIEEDNTTGRIIAIIIIVLIIAGGAWFYFAKYRKARKPIDLLKIGQRKNPEFKKPPIDYNKFIKSEETKQPTEIRRPLMRSKPIVNIVEKPVVKQVEKKVFVEKPKKQEPKYVGSKNTKTYHKSSCRFAKLIDDKYKVTSDDITYFEKLGYKPGKTCFK